MLTASYKTWATRSENSCRKFWKPFKEVENCFHLLSSFLLKIEGKVHGLPHGDSLFPTMKYCLCSSLNHFISRACACSTLISEASTHSQPLSSSGSYGWFSAQGTLPMWVYPIYRWRLRAVGGSCLCHSGIWSVAELAARSVGSKAFAFSHPHLPSLTLKPFPSWYLLSRHA